MIQLDVVPSLFAILFVVMKSSEVLSENFYSSIDGMEKLLQTEANLLQNLKEFTAKEEQLIIFLEERLTEYEYHHQLASADVVTYVSNPLNAFLITKRLTDDWQNIEKLINRTMSEDVANLTKDLQLPSDQDLNGVAVGLKRLQETYNLDTTSMINGLLNGHNFSSVMTADDCYVIGVELHLNMDFEHSVLWLNEANKRVDPSDQERRIDILRFLSNSAYGAGDVLTALKTTNELLKIAPDYKAALENKQVLENIIIQYKITISDAKSVQNVPEKIGNINLFSSIEDVQLNFERLCRKEVLPSPKQMASMRCKYDTNTTPFLRIAPLKLEELSLDPYIVIYHDAIFDSEIDFIKETAKPNLKQARTKDHITGKNLISYTRTSKMTFFKDHSFNETKMLVHRLKDMTGLSLETAEKLQVVNYGIGGHYGPHVDFFYNKGKRGSRIATVLFYMNDVIQGGATVFPIINTIVPAEKGKAAVWYNLDRAGNGDFRTRHGSCPVLIGAKWVCNKWLREFGQEFRRPCDLNRDTLESNDRMAQLEGVNL